MRQRTARHQGKEPRSAQQTDVVAWVKGYQELLQYQSSVFKGRREAVRALADPRSAREVEGRLRTASQEAWEVLLSEPLSEAPLLEAMQVRFDWFKPVHKALGAQLQRAGQRRLLPYLVVLTGLWSLAAYVAWWHQALSTALVWNLGVMGPLVLLWVSWSLGRWGWLMRSTPLGRVHGRLSVLLQREQAALVSLKDKASTVETEKFEDSVHADGICPPWFWCAQLWDPQEQQRYVHTLYHDQLTVREEAEGQTLYLEGPKHMHNGLCSMMLVNARLFDNLPCEPKAMLWVMVCWEYVHDMLTPEMLGCCMRSVTRYAQRLGHDALNALACWDRYSLTCQCGDATWEVNRPDSLRGWWEQARDGTLSCSVEEAEDAAITPPCSPPGISRPYDSAPPKLRGAGSLEGVTRSEVGLR